MSLLLDALYKASKDKEKAAELALVPRQEDTLPAQKSTLGLQDSPATAQESVAQPQEFQLELPEPFVPSPLPEPQTSPHMKASSDIPFPSLELELEPRPEENKKESSQELALAAVSSPELQPEPISLPEASEPQQPLQEHPPQPSLEPVLTVPPQPEPLAPEQPAVGSEADNLDTDAIKPATVQGVKQPGKIAQILSRSKKPASRSSQINKRTLVLGGVAGLMAIAMVALLVYESGFSGVAVPVAAVKPPVVSAGQEQPVVQEEVVSTEIATVDRSVLVTPNADQKKNVPLKQNVTTQVPQHAQTAPVSSAPDVAGFKPQLAPVQSDEPVLKPKSTKPGSIVASVKPNHLALAYAALLDGRLEEASQSYAKILQTNAQEPNALLGLATIAHQRGQREEALDYYQRVLRQDPGNVTATAAVLALDTRLDSNTASLKARELVDRQPDSVAALTVAANALVRDGRVAEAALLFARAEGLEPQNPLHVYNYAVALDRLGQIAQAIEQYKKVIKMTESHLPTSVRPFSLEAVKLRLAELSQSFAATYDNLK